MPEGRCNYATACCLCCCGGLPILAIIKAAFTIPLCIVVSACGNIAISLILLPHDVFLSYVTLIRAEQIGCNLKIGLFILLPFPLIIWPLIVAVGSVIFNILYPLGLSFMATFDDDSNLFIGGTCLDCSDDDASGFKNPLTRSFKSIRDFWDFNYHSYFGYLAEIRSYRLPSGEQPFDIPITQVVVGFTISVICCCFAIIINTPLFLIKFPIFIIASLLRLIYTFFYFLTSSSDCIALCVIYPLGFCLLLIAWPLYLAGMAIVYLAIAPLSIGLMSAVKAYQSGSTVASFILCFECISSMNSVLVAHIICCFDCSGDGCMTDKDYYDSKNYRYLPTCGNSDDYQREYRINNGNNAHSNSLDVTVNVSGDNVENPPEERKKYKWTKKAMADYKQMLNQVRIKQKDSEQSLRVASQLRVASTKEVLVGLPKIYDLLYEQIELLLLDGLTKGFITHDSLMYAHDSAPNDGICKNVFEAAAVQVCVRSLQHPEMGVSDLLMSDGTVVTPENQPFVIVGEISHGRLVDIKTALSIISKDINIRCKGGAAPAVLVEAVGTRTDLEAPSISLTGESKDALETDAVPTAAAVVVVLNGEEKNDDEDGNIWPILFKEIMTIFNPGVRSVDSPNQLNQEELKRAVPLQKDQEALIFVKQVVREMSGSIVWVPGFRRRFQVAANNAIIKSAR